MIDGIWWLVILFSVVAILWLIAQRRGGTPERKASLHTTKNASARSNSPAKPTRASKPFGSLSLKNDPLDKTAMIVKKSFVDYQVSRRTNHLLITKQGVKIAMITIDKKIAVGQRRLGDVPIVNYHSVPSRAQLSADLQTVETVRGR